MTPAEVWPGTRSSHFVSTGALLSWHKRVSWLFLAMAAYMAMPVGDLPWLDVSLSAPLVGLLTLELFLGPGAVRLARYRRWTSWTAVFWFGSFLSLAVNVCLGEIASVTIGDVLVLVHLGFWMVAFLVTTVVVTETSLAGRTATVLGLTAILLGLARVGEGVLLGTWSSSRPMLMTQNSYGLEFSTFTPFAVLLLVTQRGRRRILALFGLAVLLLGIISNPSRSSWVAVAAGLVVFGVVFAVARRSVLLATAILLVVSTVGAGILILMPETAKAPIERRFSTFQRLEQDKSYVVRTVLVQKGWRLFLENPVVGVGAGRFRSSVTELDLPPLLRHSRQESFDAKNPHNSYVPLLAETGVVGTTPYALLLVVLTTVGLWASLRAAREGVLWPVAAYASFIGMSIHCWTIAGRGSTAPWFVYGLMSGVIQREWVRHSAAHSLSGRHAPRASVPI